MVCFRGNEQEALTGVTLYIIGQHLLDSFPLPIRSTFSPWSLHHYLVHSSLRWWNVFADLDQTAWDTETGRAELYARQTRKFHRGVCPLSRTALDRWRKRFHTDAGEIPTMLKRQMLIVDHTLPELAQCSGSMTPDDYAFTQHAVAKTWYDSESDGEGIFESGRFHGMCSARSIR